MNNEASLRKKFEELSARRGQRAIRMVAELHKRGFQLLQIMPFFTEYGEWRMAISEKRSFSGINGAFLLDESLRCGETAVFASNYADDSHIEFDDAGIGPPGSKYDVEVLSDIFLRQFDGLANRSKGENAEYADWLIKLLDFLDGQPWLPFVQWQEHPIDCNALAYLPILDLNCTLPDNDSWFEITPFSSIRKFSLPPRRQPEGV